MNAYVVCEHAATRQRLSTLLPDFTIAESPPDHPVDLLLRWGSSVGEDRATVVLNPKNAVEASRFHHHVASAVRTNRISVASFTRLPARYRVYLFDLRSFAIMRRSGRRWSLIRPSRKLRESLVIRARRALYALGLHAGCVEMSRGDGRKYVVIRVNSGPAMGRTVSARFAKALKQFIDERRYDPTGRTIVLGADPEFILRSRRTGRLVTANRFFPYRGLVGHDRLHARFLRGRPLAELRPAPSSEPEVLFRHLKRAIRRAMAKTGRRIEFTAGSLPFSRFPIGGHVHFSGIPLTTDFLRALDLYLAVPLLLIDNPARSWRRRLKYGFLGDFRFQRHGGFEYRTLPSWLVSPTIALAVLCLAKVVAQEYHRLPLHFLQEIAMQQAFYSANKDPFYRRFNEMWSYLEEVPSYRQYENELLPLKRWVDAQKVWPDRSDLKQRWFTRRRRTRTRRRSVSRR